MIGGGGRRSRRSGGSEAVSLLRSPTSRQKPAHRFAESGYIFELGFIFSNNPSILDLFAFQYDS